MLPRRTRPSRVRVDDDNPAGPAAPLLSRRWAALLAVVAGLAGMAAFPSLGWWPLAVLSVAGLSAALHGRRSRTGAWLGYLYGLAFFGPLLHWSGVYVGAVPWLLLTAFEALFLAGLGAVLPIVSRQRFAPLWIASAWVLQEALRGRLPFGGFPWGRLVFSQADSPLRWFATLGGAPLASFAVALAGAVLAVGVIRTARGGPALRWRPVALYAAGVVAVPLAGGALAWWLGPAPDHEGTRATVALVQGSVPDVGLDFETRAREVLDNHVSQTLRLAAQIRSGTVPAPSLVLWPENSSDVDPYTDAYAAREISRAATAVGVPILVGAIQDGPGPDHRRNLGILWTPERGPVAEYIKRHPVPFGEYIPLRGIAELVSSDVDLVSRDMVGGHGDGVIKGGPFLIGDVICFEVAYDGLVRSAVDNGAQLMVVQTNNATFGHTDETYQQLAMSQIRAVETGRTVLQVATTGVSAVIGPDGGIRQRSGALYTPALLVADVPLRTNTTPATRLGVVPEYVLAALAAAAIGWALRPVRRPERAPEADNTEEMVST